MTVDLPAPFPPSSATTSPERTEKLTSRTASVPPNRLTMPSNRSAATTTFQIATPKLSISKLAGNRLRPASRRPSRICARARKGESRAAAKPAAHAARDSIHIEAEDRALAVRRRLRGVEGALVRREAEAVRLDHPRDAPHLPVRSDAADRGAPALRCGGHGLLRLPRPKLGSPNRSPPNASAGRPIPPLDRHRVG